MHQLVDEALERGLTFSSLNRENWQVVLYEGTICMIQGDPTPSAVAAGGGLLSTLLCGHHLGSVPCPLLLTSMPSLIFCSPPWTPLLQEPLFPSSRKPVGAMSPRRPRARYVFNWQCAELIEVFTNIARMEWQSNIHPGSSIEQLGFDVLR